MYDAQHTEAMRQFHQSTLEQMRHLVQRATLVLEVDKGWATIYTALRKAGGDERLKQFFDEFSTANTVEQQASVLDKWGHWRT